MERVNVLYYYRLGSEIQPLGSVRAGEKRARWCAPLIRASDALKDFASDPLNPLTLSIEAANEAIAAIEPSLEAYQAPDADWERLGTETIDSGTASTIANGVRNFETVFAAESARQDVYLITKKGIYSTADLVEKAEHALSADALDALSDGALRDFSQAGRSLALELPTASGFHVMRSVEAVLRDYHALVMTPTAGGDPPEMAQAINQIRACDTESEKLLGVLDQLRNLHRNPLAHPEIFLDTDEAMTLFNMAVSAICAMLTRIKQLTSAASPALVAARRGPT